MKIEEKLRLFGVVGLILFVGIIFSGIGQICQVRLANAAALELGKTYDQTNYQEVQDLLAPPVLNWVKDGEFTIPTAKLEYEWKVSDPNFLAATQKNVGKLEIINGWDCEKATGKRAKNCTGYLYPTIDPKDPNAPIKIINNYYATFRWTDGQSVDESLVWIGQGGMERMIKPAVWMIFYVNRSNGDLKPNPNNFQFTQVTGVNFPFELKGTTQMLWFYDDDRESSAWAYVAAIRRVRRVSAAIVSDPFMGSDFCLDDGNGWAGKNNTMTWKLVGEGTFLAPFVSAKKANNVIAPDGTLLPDCPALQCGYQVPGWKGAPRAPTNEVWSPRPCWLVEANPKDPYYNYGRTIYYIDKEMYNIFLKQIYDRAGQYWKTAMFAFGDNDYPNKVYGGTTYVQEIAIDSKTHHASANIHHEHFKKRQPLSVLGPNFFTEANMIELSK